MNKFGLKVQAGDRGLGAPQMLSTGTKVLFRNHFIVMRDSARLAGVAFGNRISNLATSVHHAEVIGISCEVKQLIASISI